MTFRSSRSRTPMAPPTSPAPCTAWATGGSPCWPGRWATARRPTARPGSPRRSLSGSPVTPDDVLTCEFTRDGGYSAMRGLIEQTSGTEPGGLPELVFAVNDVMAVGAMAAVRDAGLSVPDDVAAAGFDDIHTLRDVSPGLTTVRIELAEVGALATELALGRSAETRTRVRGEVVLRDSTPRR
ncbi:substrate-binding domain-containing protein [Promicromonospora soli]